MGVEIARERQRKSEVVVGREPRAGHEHLPRRFRHERGRAVVDEAIRVVEGRADHEVRVPVRVEVDAAEQRLTAPVAGITAVDALDQALGRGGNSEEKCRRNQEVLHGANQVAHPS